MYTGVVRRPRAEVEEDEKAGGPGAPTQRETQLVAVADGDLSGWRKVEAGAGANGSGGGGDGNDDDDRGGFLPRPPRALGPLSGWRDPFLVAPPAGGAAGGGPRWLLVGSGLRGRAGTATVYCRRGEGGLGSGHREEEDAGRDDGGGGAAEQQKEAADAAAATPALALGWEYRGLLATDPSCVMWECPMLVELPPHPEDGEGGGGGGGNGSNGNNGGNGHGSKEKEKKKKNNNNNNNNNKSTWLLSASPDYCANVSEYWLGAFDAEGTGAFVPQGAATAEGSSNGDEGGDGSRAEAPPPFCLGAFPPELLDLGDILYAPNVLLPTAASGGLPAPVMWAWAQERGRPELALPAEAAAAEGQGSGKGQGEGGLACSPPSGTTSGRTYSCCLTAPRVLYARPCPKRGGVMRLWQEPLPALARLRVEGGGGGGGAWPLPDRLVASTAASSPPLPLPLSRATAAHADVTLTLRLSGGATGFALVLRPLSWPSSSSSSPSSSSQAPPQPPKPQPQGLVLTFDARSCAFAAVHGSAWRAGGKALARLAALPAPRPRRVLHLPPPPVGEGEQEEDQTMGGARDQALASRAAAEAEEDCGGEGCGEGGAEQQRWRRTGGMLDLPCSPSPAQEITLRLLLDGSLVEAFCLSSGQALATRCYRCGYDQEEEDEDEEGGEGGSAGAADADDNDAERAPLALYAFGGGAASVVEVVRGESYAMRSCFAEDDEAEEEEEAWEKVEAGEGAGAAGATAAVSLVGGGAAAAAGKAR
jgi:hypothetical protein